VDCFAHDGTVGSCSVNDCNAVSALSREAYTSEARSVFGIPVLGF